MLKKVIIIFFAVFVILGCEQPTNGITTIYNNISIIWKGSLSDAPANPENGWAYYSTTLKSAFIWDGSNWQILAQDGISIIWKGELPSDPINPQLNWAYYNIIDGNSYIYNGSGWDLLSKSGRDGSSGILQWIGSLASAPANPSAGWAYHNSTDGVSYIWDGLKWEVLVRDGIVWKGVLTSPPENPQINWAYFDSVSSKSYIWNGSSWQIMAESGNAVITVLITWKGSLTAAPLNPEIGWMYYNSVLGRTYIWDGTSWEITAQDGTSPEGFLITWRGGLSSAPSNPQTGWAYYNTSQKKSFIWDGSSWQILAQDGLDGEGSEGAYPSRYLYVLVNTPNDNYTESASQSIGTVDFGSVGVGSTSRTSMLYISIQGISGDSLVLTGSPLIQLSGANADNFSVTQPSVTTASTGNFIMDASISFTPASLGFKTATITIPNNSPDKPDFSFTITGTGSLWPKIYDSGEGDGDDQITCSVVDSQGNIYFIGFGFELVSHYSGYDWWIKKIDSSGNEIITGWNKKMDFYSNYSSYSYDRPTNAIIDHNDNLIVSDNYTTVKFAPDGSIMWEKNTGGTLYNDYQNNIFIVTSSNIIKYNPAGTQLWVKPYTGQLAFDSIGNIAVYADVTVRYLSANGTENWTILTGDSDTTVTPIDGWYNSSIFGTQQYPSFTDSDGVEYWRFPVIAGKDYRISWNDNYGDGTKTAYLYVSAFYDDEERTSVLNRVTSGWTTSRTFTAQKTGSIIIKTELTYSAYFGTYSLQVSEWFNNGASITDGWYDSSLTANSNELYVVPVTMGTRYIIAWNDRIQGDGTKTGNVNVSAYWEDDNVSIFGNTTSGWNSPREFLATRSGNIVVRIQTNSSSAGDAGTYAVVVRPATPIALSEKIKPMTINSAVFDSAGNIYLAGFGRELFNQFSRRDVWIKKYNYSNGTEISGGWNKKFDWNTSDDEWATNIMFDGTNIIVIGQGNDIISGSSKNDTWVKKFNTSGLELYSFVIPDDNANLVKIDSAENYYFSSGSFTSTLFRRYNTSGNLLSSFSWNSRSPYISPPSFIMDNANNIYMYGYASNLVTSLSGYDWIIRKFNNNGVEQ